MKYLTTICKLLFFLLATIRYSDLQGQDIALGRPYQLDPPPNYLFREDANSLLTDGVYCKSSNFWGRPTSLGWVKVPQVTVSVDLGDIVEVSSASFNTCEEVDSLFHIYFPDHIYIFLSIDNIHFSFAGDACKPFTDVPGPYSIHKFTLDSIDVKARFVKFIVVPHGFFVFSDEISVEKNIAKKDRKLPVLNGSVNEAVDSLLVLHFNKKYLEKLDENIHREKRSLPNIEVALISPWDSIGPYVSGPSQRITGDTVNFLVPQGGSVYGAFVVQNNTSSDKYFKVTAASPYSVASLHLFTAAFVPVHGYTKIPDALLPITDSLESLPQNQQKMIFFKITGLKSGKMEAEIKVRSGQFEERLRLSINTITLQSFSRFALNSNVWFNDYHPMVVDRRENAFQDLEKHHINTLIVGPGYLSPLNKTSFSSLPSLLTHAQFSDKLLISSEFSNLHLREPDPQTPFMSEGWKEAFVTWYDKLLSVITRAGFSSSQVYFYPYDEVRGKNIRDFIHFARWIKSEVPEVQLYATITRSLTDSTEAFDELLPFLDIAQIACGPPILLPKLPKHSGEIWVYENSGQATSQSPYGFYRLMAWDAYLKNITGIGFWSYTGDPRIKKVTDAFRDLDMDYGVVYDGPAKSIISSRRWEGFSLGIEDYQVLYLYGQKFGVSKAKAIAQEVIAHPENKTLADSLKNMMLRALAANEREY